MVGDWYGRAWCMLPLAQRKEGVGLATFARNDACVTGFCDCRSVYTVAWCCEACRYRIAGSAFMPMRGLADRSPRAVTNDPTFSTRCAGAINRVLPCTADGGDEGGMHIWLTAMQKGLSGCCRSVRFHVLMLQSSRASCNTYKSGRQHVVHCRASDPRSVGVRRSICTAQCTILLPAAVVRDKQARQTVLR